MKFLKQFIKLLLFLVTTIVTVFVVIVINLFKIITFPFKYISVHLLNNILKVMRKKRHFFETDFNYEKTIVLKILVEIDSDIKFIENLQKYITKY